MQRIAIDINKGIITEQQIDEGLIASYLSLAECEEPDLFIRTSGEQRISNFLLWQLAYTELYFTPTLWPDFDEKAMNEALLWYGARQRRFGMIVQEIGNTVNA
jgi:undecaprenyl diphosphate synthase